MSKKNIFNLFFYFYNDIFLLNKIYFIVTKTSLDVPVLKKSFLLTFSFYAIKKEKKIY